MATVKRTKKPAKKTVVLSLGGSLLVPNEINAAYIKKFVEMINGMTRSYRFIIFTGGGRTARNYQAALRKVANVDNDALDWVGILSSHVNAELVKQSFGGKAKSGIITDPRVKISWGKDAIVIGAGWKPGRSTDYDAVKVAEMNNIHKVINLSNIDYVYTKDPNKYKTAERIEDISWKDFRKIIGSDWDPGLNVPFDPIAAKLAQRANIEVNILNGSKLDNVKKAIQGKAFIGTSVQ